VECPPLSGPCEIAVRSAVLALQGDVTRVVTFQLAREPARARIPRSGYRSPHRHPQRGIRKCWRRLPDQSFHVDCRLFHWEVSDADGAGTLLDHSMYLYGSGMGNPDVHNHVNVPMLVAGGGAGNLKGGRHIKYAEPTPLANLHLTLLDKAGVRLDASATVQAR